MRGSRCGGEQEMRVGGSSRSEQEVMGRGRMFREKKVMRRRSRRHQ